MEEFLKDSPSDFNAANSNSNNAINTSSGLSNIPFNSNDQNFSFNLDYGANKQPISGSNTANYPTIPENEYLSPTNNNFLNEANNFNSSFTNDPFLDDLETLNYTNQQQNQQPQQSQQSQYINPSTTSNFDEIVSPQNGVSLPSNNNALLNPQYFSPPNRSTNNFNSLNSIAEDGLSGSFSNNAFSPSMSRHGSISVSANNQFNYNMPDINSGSYLSPQAHPQYISPSNNTYDSSFDTLRSPSFTANSYLNSPPQFQNIRIPSSSQQSTNIQKNPIMTSPTAANFSTSVPNIQSNTRENISTKQLSKEEKLKRRREFHNAVERRRRDLIKERIKELGLLVPPSLLNPQLCAVQTLQRNSQLHSREINDLLSTIKVKETKPNKSTILNKSVDYILHLKYVLKEQDKTRIELLQKIKDIEDQLNTESQPELQQLEPQKQTEQLSQLNQDNFFNPDDFFSDSVSNPNQNTVATNATSNDFFDGLN